MFSCTFKKFFKTVPVQNTFERLFLLLYIKYEIYDLFYYIHWTFHVAFLCHFKYTSKNKR